MTATYTAEQLVTKRPDVANAIKSALRERMQRESITPELIRLRGVEARIKAIEKWDGKMPQVSGGAVPFINVQPEAR